MFERLRSKARAWLSRRFGDSGLPGDLTELELRKKVRELEVQKDEHKRAMERLEDKWRDAAERVAAADENELPAVRSDLGMLTRRYRERRREYMETLSGLAFLQRLSLMATHEEGVDGFDVDWDDLRTDVPLGPPDGGDEVAQWLDGGRDRNPGSPGHGVGGTGPCHGAGDAYGESITLEFREDPLVEPVVTAARNDDPIPSLDELLDDGDEGDDEDDLGLGDDDSDSLVDLGTDSSTEDAASAED